MTPEATEAVCDKLLDGFGELMRAVSLKVVPTAILSRQVAGVRGRSLIVNLPGKPRRHPRLPVGSVPGCTLLRRFDRRAVSDHERRRGKGVSAQVVALSYETYRSYRTYRSHRTNPPARSLTRYEITTE